MNRTFIAACLIAFMGFTFSVSAQEAAVAGLAYDAQTQSVMAFNRNGIPIGQEMTRRNLNIQPTLTIPPGMQVRIIVARDLVLRAYQPLSFNKGIPR